MVSMAADTATATSNNENLISELEVIAGSSFIPATGIQRALVEGWDNAVTVYSEDNAISEEEEANLTQYMEKVSLSKDHLDVTGAYSRLVKGVTIREVMEGNIPSRLTVDGVLPFNLQKSESLVWVWQDVPYYEQRTRRERVGGYRGVSVRVTKGVYYHTGGFNSRSVERTQTEHLDTGILGVTTKQIYFAGASKRFRVPFSKVVTFEPYSDGIGIMRDAASAKPQTFITGDGWFTYNLVANLAQL
jgi:hypothetical protein